VRIGFNETDARRMFAGSDFLLMPSRYEPCGLSQMYAQRFGSLPVARNTGGLADTIENGVTGFLFDESTAESYREALSRAFKVFAFPDLLNAMRCRAMARRSTGARRSNPTPNSTNNWSPRRWGNRTNNKEL
jgi:starch synthase